MNYFIVNTILGHINALTNIIFSYLTNILTDIIFQSTGEVEYTDCISAEEVRPLPEWVS